MGSSHKLLKKASASVLVLFLGLVVRLVKLPRGVVKRV